MATITALTERARELGTLAADAYRDEFGSSPESQTVGDWDTLAWGESWHDLVNEGATEGDHNGCLAAWRTSFFAD